MDTVASSSPDSLVAEPASITLVKAFLEGRLQLLRAGDDSTDIFAGLLSLQEGQSIATSDWSVVEHHTWDMRGREEKKYRTKGRLTVSFYGIYFPSSSAYFVQLSLYPHCAFSPPGDCWHFHSLKISSLVSHLHLTCGSHCSINASQIKSRLSYYRSHFRVGVRHTGWDGQWEEGVDFPTNDLLTLSWSSEAWVQSRSRCHADNVWERGSPHGHSTYILTS